MTTTLRLPQAALDFLTGTINRLLALDPEGSARLRTLQGRVIGFEITGIETGFFVVVGDGRVDAYAEVSGEPDCTLRGSPLALARLSWGPRKEDHLFRGEVQIRGDTRVAQEFGEVLAGLDIDWEEQLARLIGDPLAHQAGNQVRAIQSWGRRTSEVLTEDLAEYLKEEARLVPTRHEVEWFLTQVDVLRDDVERLAARIERLRQRLG